MFVSSAVFVVLFILNAFLCHLNLAVFLVCLFCILFGLVVRLLVFLLFRQLKDLGTFSKCP